jgi:ribosomal protein S18 acetylase RimI-like enzyme
MVRVRAAAAGDAGELARLNRHIQDLHLAAEPHLYRSPDPGEIEEWFRAELAAGESTILVAEADADGQAAPMPAGYLVLRVVDRPENPFLRARRLARVDQIAVHASHRRAGVGRALLRAAEALAREARCSEIELVVRSLNAAAERFYEHLGYRPVEQVMARPLPPG